MLNTSDDSSELQVSGLITGSRGFIGRTVDSFGFLDPMGVRNRIPGVWGRLSLTTSIGKAEVECETSGWRVRKSELKVERMDPDPVPWLRNFFTHASRVLDAYGSYIPSADVAWQVTRLRLMFGEGDRATAAVDEGLGHLRKTGATEADIADVRQLDTLLRVYGCTVPANRLREYLDRLPR